MKKTVLQIPMDLELRKAAEKVALSEGFSSLQEYTRVLLTKTAKRELKLVPGDIPYVDKETEKAIGQSLAEYEAGQYTETRGPKELQASLDKLKEEA